MDDIKDDSTFHLGITMAGAVSAGCYTAGVLDYLFEVLDLWDKAKKGEIEGIDNELVPKNKVLIDAMGGTSAGGMATVISSLYAISGKINSVKEVPENPMQSQNLLYDSWVHLDDNEEGKTFSKIWDTDDLKENLGSLFNSKVIDAISEKSFNNLDLVDDFTTHIKEKLPAFISPDLELLISHTLLRGIPLAVDFNAEIAKRRIDSPNHSTFEHYLISHFKLNKGNPVDENNYLWLNPYQSEYANKIKLSTISTGAFPIGLKYRDFDKSQFNESYIKSVLKRILYGDFGKENPDENNKIDFGNKVKDYESLTVDGGAINNEPYREVASILTSKFLKNEEEHQNFGLLMIDPFPDSSYDKKKYKKPKGLLGVAPRIIKTLWNQSKVKRKEMLEQYDSKYYKAIIFPKKYYTEDDLETITGQDTNPLTSASFGAFGGFLDVNFRVHDFFLGRNNARNFIQFFGSFLYDPDNNNVHPMHKDWTPEMVEKFKITKEKDPRVFLPIIPDLNILLEGYKSGKKRFDYDCRFKPKYDPSELFALKGKIKNRFIEVIDRGIKDVSDIDKGDKDHPISDALIRDAFRKSFFGRIGSKIGGWIISGLKRPVKKTIANLLTKIVIKTILNDLEDGKILKTKK